MIDRRKVGHPEQAAFVRSVRYTDGRARGLEALQFYNGVLDFTVLKDKCLDFGDMRYRGVNAAFLAKTGLMAPQCFDLDMHLDQQSGLMGGFMFTCGLSNAGARCEIDGESFPFHGKIRSAPAESLSYGATAERTLFAEGIMREAVLQGRSLALKRRIETVYQQPSLSIHDTITNEGFGREPVMAIYHINFGWPFLDEDTVITIPSLTPLPDRFGSPCDRCEETVIPHDAVAGEDGYVTCRVENSSLGMGVSVRYKKEELPCLGEWRSSASGDYVLGIEPGLCGIDGRKKMLESGSIRELEAGESIEARLTIRFYDC